MEPFQNIPTCTNRYTHTRVYAFTESFFQAEMVSNGSKMVTVRFFCDDSEIEANKIDVQNTNT